MCFISFIYIGLTTIEVIAICAQHVTIVIADLIAAWESESEKFISGIQLIVHSQVWRDASFSCYIIHNSASHFTSSRRSTW